MKALRALQFRLVSTAGARVEATISRRGAALRALSVDGVDLVEPTAMTEPAPKTAGATLVPWPNRIEGARWDLDGTEQLLEVSEPDLGHAIHGLLVDTDYDVVLESPHEIELSALMHDMPGYPFQLEVGVRYSLDTQGIRVAHSVRNVSSRTAPFGMGAHPYVCVGEHPVEGLELRIQANRALDLDSSHIPRGEFLVEGSAWDLRAGSRVSDAVPHATYTGLAHADGHVVHRLRSGTGTAVELWADRDFRWVQVYVDHAFVSDRGARTAIAIEPMTAPPNALRSGDGLLWLQPGERWDAEWGIRLA